MKRENFPEKENNFREAESRKEKTVQVRSKGDINRELFRYMTL